MPQRPYDAATALTSCGLDLSRPFTTAMARDAGIAARALGRIVEEGLVTRTLEGVFHATALTDSLELRLACVRLVLPEGCVVTDRTAGWLHGASMVLAPNSHLVVPRVQAFHRPGNRLRNALTASGERQLLPRDVTELGGVAVTTPLRTACDLGRLLHRDSAFAALDALLRLRQFSQEDLLHEVERFKGYRGVRQLRAFAPLSDPGSQSFGESALRLRWYDAVLDVVPEAQIFLENPRSGAIAYLDIGTSRWRYAAEYDGEGFHGAAQEEHDRARRAWIDELGWSVDVFRRTDVFGDRPNTITRLRQGLSRAKVRFCAGSAR